MKRGLKFSLVLVLIFLVAGIGIMGWNTYRRHQAEAQWVLEAVHEVEQYFQEGKQDAAEAGSERVKIDNQVTFDRKAILDKFGTLTSIYGDGYAYPAWNIQGYHYLTAQRTMNFSKGPVPVRIHVTEGRVTAPGLTEVHMKPEIGYDYANHMTIFVSHPRLHP